MILLDTNVLIEVLKGDLATQDRLSALPSPFHISSISAMELIYGAFDKREVKKLQAFLQLFQVIHLNESISVKAIHLVEQYAKSHALDIPDSLIAATAISSRAKLYTYNRKDFQFITDLQLLAK